MSEDNPWGWVWDRFHDLDLDAQDDAAKGAGAGGVLGNASGDSQGIPGSGVDLNTPPKILNGTIIGARDLGSSPAKPILPSNRQGG